VGVGHIRQGSRGTLLLSAPVSGHARPVAQAVADPLSITISPPISRAEVWLAQTPDGVEQCVRDVVVLAAITAMEQGQRFTAAKLVGDPQETPGSSLVEQTISRVVVEFWGRLRGVAALGGEWGQVGPRHPLLRVVSGELHCSRPEPLEMGD